MKYNFFSSLSEKIQIYNNFKVINSCKERISIKPFITIVVPHFNYGEYINDNINSILGQSFQQFEIIIVDDCSTNIKSKEIIKEQLKKDPRINAIFLENNVGVSEARNIGISKSKSELVFALDVDDCLNSLFLEKCINVFLNKSDAGFVYSWFKIFGCKNIISEYPQYDFNKLKNDNICGNTSIVRKIDWFKVGGYRRIPCEDWDFSLNLGKGGLKGYCIEEPLYYYRKHKNSLVDVVSGDKNMKDYHFKLFKYYNRDIFINEDFSDFVIKDDNYSLNSSDLFKNVRS